MQECLQKLIEGNKRFARGESIHPNLGSELRNALVNEQKPFAAIIACSDSRVPIEIIFDVGLGDLFVIRTAGHVLSKETLGSLEYAVTTLGVKFVMILGHDNCGAVKSALSAYFASKNNKFSPNLQALLDHIFPLFEKMDLSNKHSLDNVIKTHIKYQVEDLMKKDLYLAEKVHQKEIMVVGAKYNLETGLVEIL